MVSQLSKVVPPGRPTVVQNSQEDTGLLRALEREAIASTPWGVKDSLVVFSTETGVTV